MQLVSFESPAAVGLIYIGPLVEPGVRHQIRLVLFHFRRHVRDGLRPSLRTTYHCYSTIRVKLAKLSLKSLPPYTGNPKVARHALHHARLKRSG
jgi:hypothetical protein